MLGEVKRLTKVTPPKGGTKISGSSDLPLTRRACGLELSLPLEQPIHCSLGLSLRPSAVAPPPGVVLPVALGDLRVL